MTKVNKKNKKKSGVKDTVQLAGGFGPFAAKQGAYEQLRRCVLSCLLWEDLAYETAEQNAENIASLIPLVEPAKVAALAIECREKQKLRHVPLYMAVVMARHASHKPYVREVLRKVITRVDQMADTIAIYWKDGKKPLPKCIQNGIAEIFGSFNEYQYAKYCK